MIGRAPTHDDLTDLVRAWQDALETLERDVEVAERMLTGPFDVVPAMPTGHDAWQPPQLGGPIPEGLVARARDLLRRQSSVREALTGALEQTRAGLAQLRPTELAPAYVDISA